MHLDRYRRIAEVRRLTFDGNAILLPSQENVRQIVWRLSQKCVVDIDHSPNPLLSQKTA